MPRFPQPGRARDDQPGQASRRDPVRGRRLSLPPTIKVSKGTLNTFDDGRLLLAQTARLIDGTRFFIGKLPASACSYRSLELDVKAGHNSSQHNLGFGTCAPGKLVAITDSMGSWSGP